MDRDLVFCLDFELYSFTATELFGSESEHVTIFVDDLSEGKCYLITYVCDWRHFVYVIFFVKACIIVDVLGLVLLNETCHI